MNKYLYKNYFINLYNFFQFSKERVIRKESHGNDIKVLYFPGKKIFRKISTTPSGQKLLDCEHAGFKWYLKKIKKNQSKFLKNFFKSKDYSQIDIKKFDGIKINYNDPLVLNYKYLNQCIFHYCKIWPKRKIVPCHGDMTLDNIIFRKNKIAIIDWEHFKKSGEQWGFDIAYLVLSAVSFPHYKNLKIPDEDQKILRKLWKRLNLLGLKGTITVKPIDVFKKTFKSKYHWQKIIKRSPNKLFPYILTNRFINHLHSIIN